MALFSRDQRRERNEMKKPVIIHGGGTTTKLRHVTNMGWYESARLFF